MEIRAKINIVGDEGEPFMGPGVLRLLQRIHEQRSINRAARQMNLSYVKALHLLNRLEVDLGRQVLVGIGISSWESAPCPSMGLMVNPFGDPAAGAAVPALAVSAVCCS